MFTFVNKVLMRVLYITQTQDMPGADRSLLQLMKELRANHGVEPFVVKPRVKLSAFAVFPPSFLLMIAVISFINKPPCFSIL